MYKMDLALNIQQSLICHKTQPTNQQKHHTVKFTIIWDGNYNQ